MPNLQIKRTSVSKALSVLIMILAAALPIGNISAQSLSRDEARAAAMVELLKEEKDKQERAQIERAKEKIRYERESATSTPSDSFLKQDNTQIVIFAIFISLLFWFAIGKHLLKIVRMAVLTRKLNRMTPEQRRQFFDNNPNI